MEHRMEHRAVRRRDKAVSDHDWMEEILRRGQVLHLGLAGGDGWPYVVTLSYGYADGAVYIHGAPEGRKNDMLAANPKVCFQVALDVELSPGETASNFSMKYRSVTCFGRLTTLTAPDEKMKALNIIMDKYAGPGGPHADMKDAAGRVWAARIDVDHMTGKRSVYVD